MLLSFAWDSWRDLQLLWKAQKEEGKKELEEEEKKKKEEEDRVGSLLFSEEEEELVFLRVLQERALEHRYWSLEGS